MMKLRSILALVLCLALMAGCLAGCGQSSPDLDSDVGSIGTTAGTQSPQQQNVMRADAVNSYSDAYILGGNIITREEVLSITFLSTLADMSADAWDVSAAQDGTVMAWVENDCDLYIAAEGGVTASSCRNLFCNYLNVTSIRFNGCFDTSSTTDMCGMFANCWKLTDVDTESLRTGAVQNMTDLFYYCSSLTNLDLSNWDVSSVTEAKNMFYHCSSLTDIGGALAFPSGCVTDGMFTDSGLE